MQKTFLFVLMFWLVCGSKAFAQDGWPVFDEVKYLQNIAANLNVEPLTKGFCRVYERYAAANVLVERLDNFPDLVKRTGIENTQVLLGRAEKDLIRPLLDQLREFSYHLNPESGYYDPSKKYEVNCDFDEYTGVNSVHDRGIRWTEVYSAVMFFKNFAKEQGFVYGRDEIPDIETINGYMRKQADLDVKALSKLTDKGDCRRQTYGLWYLITVELVAPSVLNLKADDVFRITECQTSGSIPGFYSKPPSY